MLFEILASSPASGMNIFALAAQADGASTINAANASSSG